MKGIESKIVSTVATVLMLAGCASATVSTFRNRNLDPAEPERIEQCCASCEDQTNLTTMSLIGGGVETNSDNFQPDGDSFGWNNQLDVETFVGKIYCENDNNNFIRILTWAEPTPELQMYADAYKQSYPEAPTVCITSVPSMKELNYEVSSELRLGSTMLDAFVVPPLLMGEMLRQRSGQALASWTKEDMLTSSGEESLLDDLLPYYRHNVATYGGRIRGLPILSGSQALILFRKDILDALNLPTPKTWQDWTIIASAFSNQNVTLPVVGSAGNEEKVYGACLGLLNEAGCRKQNSLGEKSCNSQSMTYLGMVMASMTQYEGSASGYMFGIDDASPNGLDQIFGLALERTLQWMENHIKNSAPGVLTDDSFDSMAQFRDGRCAWTVSVDHDEDLLRDDNIGFVPLPGSNQVLNRDPAITPHAITNCTTASCDQDCQRTESAVVCPYGKDYTNWGRVNMVPFGAVDAMVGTVSALVSLERQEEAKKFFKFVLASDIGEGDISVGETSFSRIQQPLTYSGLEKFDVPNYQEMMRLLTSSPNTAIPFRVPNAFNLLSDLDDRVYSYLIDGDYSDERRKQVLQAALKSWQMMISMYDSRERQNRQSTSMFHELSSGTLPVPTPAVDLHIGWAARGLLWILAGLSCLGSLFFALWVWTYQEQRVIRASQPVFLYLICAGTCVMASSVFTLGIEDDIASVDVAGASCIATYWLYSLGFTAVISALFSKMWMLGQVFRRPRNEQRIQVTQFDILLPFFVTFGLDCSVLSAWTILDPLQWERTSTNSDDPYSLTSVDESTEGWCTSEQSNLYIGLIFVINTAILVLSLVQSYECRRLTTEYAESTWVTITIAAISQTWFISLPLFVVLDDITPTGWFICASSTVLCTTYATLLLIFVPKMVYLYKALKREKKASLTPEETRRKLFDDNIDKSGDLASEDLLDLDHAGSLHSTRESSHSTFPLGKDPKGTIGIRIIQFTFLDNEEVNALEDAVDFAEHRNKELKHIMGRLRDNLEEHHFAKKHLFSRGPGYSFKANRRSSDISIIEAKPEAVRHSRLSRAETYLS